MNGGPPETASKWWRFMTAATELDQGAFVRALLDPDTPPPDGLEAWRGRRLDRRFSVYRNNVIGGLVGALSERFPVCLRLVGEEFFRAMAQCYACAFPPCVPMMFEYGDTFANFVSSFEPAGALPYLPDVARLEYAVGRAYHAADAAPLPLNIVRSLPAHGLDEATASFHPSMQVVPSRYPMLSIWRRDMSNEETTQLELARGEDVLVVRPYLDVEVSELPAGGSVFVHALMNGSTFQDAANEAARRVADFDLAACLCVLLANNAFAAIRVRHPGGNEFDAIIGA
jgi:hypothetical protein